MKVGALLVVGLLCRPALVVRAREGEAYMLETAEGVIANKQEVLTIPWEIIKDRDVGYVGDFPLKDSALTEVKEGSLNTTREQGGFSPNTVICSVRVKDTQAPASPPANYRMGATGGESIKHLNGAENPTAELTVWGWQKNRWYSIKAWLEYWIVKRNNPSKLAVIHSNGDVIYGGCSESELNNKYEQVIAAAGTGGTQKIVVAGEVSPFPIDLGWRYSQSKNAWAESRRASALATLGVGGDWAETYADCTDGPCNDPPKYEFANSGVIMGPMQDLYDMLKDLDTYTGDMNRLVNEYHLHNKDKVTIDYAGTVALSLHNLQKNGSLPVAVDDSSGKKTLKSKVTGQTVCFVHGNGNSFAAVKDLASAVTA